MTSLRSQTGTTLIELIITIIVLGIGLSSILLVMNRNTASSADPLILHQGIAIAEAYLEEIVEKQFDDPDGVDGEAARNLYDDIDDYNAIVNQVPQDQTGNPITGLSNYRVTVTAVKEAISSVPLDDAFRITVSVTTPASSTPLAISAYRTNYF